MKKTILLLCIVMAAMTVKAATSLPTIYVSTTGNDGNSGATDILPVKTFAKAILLVGAATTQIILAPGTYNETTIADLKAACPNLTIKGDNAANTIIDGSGITNANGRILKTTNALYIGAATGNNLTIQNLTFRKAGYGIAGCNGGGGAIYYAQSGTTKNNLTLENVIFEDNKVGIPTGTSLTASTAPRNGAALYFTANNLTINNCYFKNNNAVTGATGIGSNTCGGAIFILPLATTNQGAFATITNTTFDGNEANQSGGAVEISNFSYVGASNTATVSVKDAVVPNSYVKFTNCTFVNNKVRRNPAGLTTIDSLAIGSAIHANTQTAASFIYDFTVVNCSFANNIGGSTNAAGVGVAPWESKSTVEFDGTNYATATFVNNIINTTATANCGSALMVNTATAGTKFFGSNNIIESVHANISDASFYTAGANATEMISALVNNSTASVFAVPYLTFNYKSTAKDAGIATFGDPNIVPANDVRGTAAYIYPKKDLGAYEYDALTTGTVLSKLANNSTIARTTTGVSATFDGAAVVELYGVNGRLIEKTNAVGSYTRKLNSGLYIIRINGKATKFVK